MARSGQSEQDTVRGERFRLVCKRLFPGRSRNDIGAMLNQVSGGTIRNWENGYPLSLAAVARLEKLGASVAYLLRGEGNPLSDALPVPRRTAATEKDGGAGRETTVARRRAQIVGGNLRHLREERFPGWGGQKRFAEFLGIPANDLCAYEYGRQIPNEQRLAEMAARLGLSPEALREPLPGAVAAMVRPPPDASPAGERVWREKAYEMEQAVARLEGRNEALAEQLDRQREQIQELREANDALRGLLLAGSPEETHLWRERLFERLGSPFAALLDQRDVF